MRNIELLVDPVEVTLGVEADLPAGTKVIKPNVGATITSLKKTGDLATNYATSYASRAFSTDNYFYIGCGGSDSATWKSAAGSGTIVCFK
jgi:hypothetical protein